MKYLMKSKSFTESKTTYIKKFENLTDEPKIGDYVICKIKDYLGLRDFMNDNIGKIIKIKYSNKMNYGIQYENIPNDICSYFKYENDDSRYVTMNYHYTKDVVVSGTLGSVFLSVSWLVPNFLGFIFAPRS